MACPAANKLAHRRVNDQSLGIVDIFVAGQSAVDRLAQQRYETMLLVLADAAVFEQTIGHFGESERFVKFPVGQQPRVGCDFATQELQHQSAVEIEPPSLRREDLDRDESYAIARHDDNKGNRDDRVPLTGVVIEHLWAIASVDAMVFPWPHCERSLRRESERILRAGVGFTCPAVKTTSTRPVAARMASTICRGMNAPTLSADALQSLMRHKSYTTTQWYINMTGQPPRAVDNLYAPNVLTK